MSYRDLPRRPSWRLALAIGALVLLAHWLEAPAAEPTRIDTTAAVMALVRAAPEPTEDEVRRWRESQPAGGLDLTRWRGMFK